MLYDIIKVIQEGETTGLLKGNDAEVLNVEKSQKKNAIIDRI
jgi:hypothetical protein